MYDLNCLIFRCLEDSLCWGWVLTLPQRLCMLGFHSIPHWFLKELVNLVLWKDSALEHYKLCYLKFCLPRWKICLADLLISHIFMKTNVINLLGGAVEVQEWRLRKFSKSLTTETPCPYRPGTGFQKQLSNTFLYPNFSDLHLTSLIFFSFFSSCFAFLYGKIIYL